MYEKVDIAFTLGEKTTIFFSLLLVQQMRGSKALDRRAKDIQWSPWAKTLDLRGH